MVPKILVAAPVFSEMAYCILDFINHLKQMDYDNLKILLVDNSKSKNFFLKLRKIPRIKIIYDETKEQENLGRLINSRNKILDYAEKKHCDYLLMMDSDVMAPPNLLNKLLAHKKDVVSGLYFNYFKSDGQIKVLPVAYKSLSEEEFKKIKSEYKLPNIVKSREDLRRNITKEEIEKGELLEVLYPSSGCTLLSKRVLDSGVKYGILKTPTNLKSGDDIYFFKQLRKKGFKIYCDPSVICRHDVQGKRNSEGQHPLYK